MAIIYPACSCNVSNLSTHGSLPVEPILKELYLDAGQGLGVVGKVKVLSKGGNNNKARAILKPGKGDQR
jgi:hypothetical protein